MSLHLEFEPHSWYKGWAIRKQDVIAPPELRQYYWIAVTDNGNTYRIEELEAETLRELKQLINNRINQLNERDAYNRARLGE